jgi:hypothetical protein
MSKKYFLGLLLFLIAFAEPVSAIEQAGVEIHGFISQGFLWSNHNNALSAKTEDGSFEFNEMGINFIKELNDRLRVGTQFFSRDLGRTGNNEIVVDWAYGDYRWKDWLGIRAGLMKIPHGLYNENRDQDMVRTPVFLPQSIYPEIERDYYTRMWGGEIYGSIFLNQFGTISYRGLIGAYNPDKDNSGLRILVEGGGTIEVEKFNHGIQYSGGIQWDTPLKGLRFGVTGWIMNDAGADLTTKIAFGPNLPAGTDAPIYVKRWSTVYSLEYSWENLKIATAYRLENTKTLWPVFKWDTNVDLEGYYLSASYRFTDWLEIGSYYSVYYPDNSDKDGNRFKIYGGDDFAAWQKDFAFTTRFDFNENWLLKLEAHAIDGTADLLSSDNMDGVDRRYFLFAAKVTFSF